MHYRLVIVMAFVAGFWVLGWTPLAAQLARQLQREGSDLRRAGKYEQALNKYCEALKHTQDKYEIVDINFCIAVTLFRKGDYRETIESLKKVIALSRMHKLAWNLLASAYLKLDKIPQDKVFSEVYKLFPNKNIHQILIRQMKNEILDADQLLHQPNYNEALKRYRAALSFNVKNSSKLFGYVHARIAELLLRSNDVEQAMHHAERAIQCSPNLPIAIIVMSKLHIQKKNYAYAYEMLRYAEASFSGTDVFSKALEQVPMNQVQHIFFEGEWILQNTMKSEQEKILLKAIRRMRSRGSSMNDSDDYKEVFNDFFNDFLCNFHRLNPLGFDTEPLSVLKFEIPCGTSRGLCPIAIASSNKSLHSIVFIAVGGRARIHFAMAGPSLHNRQITIYPGSALVITSLCLSNFQRVAISTAELSYVIVLHLVVNNQGNAASPSGELPALSLGINAQPFDGDGGFDLLSMLTHL